MLLLPKVKPPSFMQTPVLGVIVVSLSLLLIALDSMTCATRLEYYQLHLTYEINVNSILIEK